MPPCYCTSHGCGGKEIHVRTHQSHLRKDTQNASIQAYEASRRALEEQEEITQLISALTLSDNVSESNSESGGRLWSRSSPTTSVAKESPDTTNGSKYPNSDKADHSLHSLKDMENEFQLLSSSLSMIPIIGNPSSRSSTFPLRSNLTSAYNLYDRLISITNKSSVVREHKESLKVRLNSLIITLKEAQNVWIKAINEIPYDERQDGDETLYVTDHHYSAILDRVDPIIQVSIFAMVCLQVILHTSRRGCRFILTMIRYILHLGFMRATNRLEPKHQKVLADFPVDAETATSKFRLEGKHTVYAVCPNSNCHKTYAPTFSQGSFLPAYPTYCTYQEFDDGDECGTRITRTRVINGVSVEVPIKEFVSFSFTDYVASLTSRPGFEDRMDAAWEMQPDDKGVSRDIFAGQFLQGFKGPDGQPFRSDGQSGRYAFSLSVDFFNPYTNKQAGKKVSVGVISVVCLNLPPSMRYKPENMFLAGVIPTCVCQSHA